MNFFDVAKSIKIFHGMNPDQLGKIKNLLEEYSFKTADWVVIEGQDATSMYMLRSGMVEVWKSFNGDKEGFCLGELKAGDCFGEMSLVDCQSRSASVLAKTDLSVYCLSYGAVAQLYETDPRLFGLLVINIAREISRRLRRSDHTLVEFALPPSFE